MFLVQRDDSGKTESTWQVVSGRRRDNLLEILASADEQVVAQIGPGSGEGTPGLQEPYFHDFGVCGPSVEPMSPT